MSKEKIIEKIDDESPQISFGKILEAEIQVAEMISTAKAKADKRVEKAQGKVASYKEEIIEKARTDREEMLTKGIAEVKKKSENQIKQAIAESEAFKEAGMNFIKEAVLQVEAIILGELNSEDE